MSTLLVSGCSFTATKIHSVPYPEYDTNYPKWPTYVNGDWDDIINVAECGSGNKSICEYALKEIYTSDKKIDVVIIALSEWTRYQRPDLKHHNPSLAFLCKNNPDYMKLREESVVGEVIRWEETCATTEKVMLDIIDKNLLALYNLIQVCESRKIKIVVFQMLRFSSLKGEKYEQVKYFLNHPLFNKLDKIANSNNEYVEIINWPLAAHLARNADQAMALYEGKHKLPHETLRVGQLDSHPNAEGHKWFGEWFNDNVTII